MSDRYGVCEQGNFTRTFNFAVNRPSSLMVIDIKQKIQNENEKQLQTNPTEMHHIVHVDTWHIAGTNSLNR